jgi:hypothetical protein
MAGRADLGKINESEFSNLLQALSSSPKGRAFLDEYRRRALPEETTRLLESLQRIDGALATLREQLQPVKIAEELARIGMTLEIALDGVVRDPEGDEAARRFVLIDQVRHEVNALASGLAGKTAASSSGQPSVEAAVIELIEDETRFFDELGLGSYSFPAER